MELDMPDMADMGSPNEVSWLARAQSPSSSSIMSAALSRRRLFALGGATIGTVGAGYLLAACGGGSSGTAAAPKASKTLTIGVYQEPDSLDPGSTGLVVAEFMLDGIFDPLVWWLPTADGSKQYYPGLATSWKVSADATSYTFKLRQDVEFHDGTHFDANAVKATFDHIVNPATKSRSAIGSLGPYKETKVIDQYTVEVVFSSPNAAFVHEMTTGLFGIVSPAAIKKYGHAGLSAHPVGTGPFTFQEYVTQDHMTVVANPKYKWGPTAFGPTGAPKLKTITFKILTDATARYNALQTGQLQLAMNLNPNDIKSVKSASGLTHYNLPSTGQPYGYPINVTKDPTTDLKVRQAINFAVDQDTLNKTVLQGAYEAAHNVLTPSTPGYDKADDTLYAYNPAKAKSLLDSAGWTAAGNATRTKNGKPLEVEILIQSANGFDLPTQYVVSQLKAVGIAAKTTSQPFVTAAASYNQGVQNLSAIFYYDVDPYLLNNLVNSQNIKAGFNWAHYTDPTVDTGIVKANGTVDEAARTALWQQITHTLMEAAIFLPLWNVSGVFSAASNLKGMHFGVTGYPFFHTASLT
jgi:peptide/nickel transport system substrate-binding protein